ncbi:MAG: malonyl-[acyl-carrier protein] O-methyltransferase BioC, partial [Betaproteobacteria bacterium]|nr:malonyl-[acyl-carrier protein] O-methyltransferase BioC [Betaproteobacteria bacterium]
MSAKIDKKQARRAFSRHGGGGDLFAEIARRLAARLDEIGIEPKWIVDIGGDGEKMA